MSEKKEANSKEERLTKTISSGKTTNVSFPTRGGFSCNDNDYYPDEDSHCLETVTLQDLNLIRRSVSSLLPYGIALVPVYVQGGTIHWFPILGRGFGALPKDDWENCFKGMLHLMDMLPSHTQDGNSPVEELSLNTIKEIFQGALVNHFQNKGIVFNPDEEDYVGLLNDNEGTGIPRFILNVVGYIKKRLLPQQLEEEGYHRHTTGIEITGGLLYLQSLGWEIPSIGVEVMRLEDDILSNCRNLYDVLACLHILTLAGRGAAETLNAVIPLLRQKIPQNYFCRYETLTKLLQITLEVIRSEQQENTYRDKYRVYQSIFGGEWEGAGMLLLDSVEKIIELSTAMQKNAESITVQHYPDIVKIERFCRWY